MMKNQLPYVGRFVSKLPKLTICAILLVFLSCSPLVVKAADWESEANARIEQNRKRNAQITIVDVNGDPVPGLTVKIEQVKHRFAFGTCIRNSMMGNTNYKNFISNHFEWAVCENETKWTENEKSRDYETYSSADTIYTWCNQNGIIMRGHTLFWEQWTYVQSWVQSLGYATYPTSSDLLSEVDERINSAMAHFPHTKFRHWDVINEMLPTGSDYRFYDRLGEAGRVHIYQQARSVDPCTMLFMNEYTGNSFGGYSSSSYVSRANSLISMGAPIDAFGIQAHLLDDAAFQPQSYYDNVLQPLAALGKPIWATEFDASHTDLNISADNLENFFRICFSHSSVDGIIMWGFWQNQMWRVNSYLVLSNGVTLSPQGVRYEALMNEWTTNLTNTSDLDGQVSFRGFHGRYKIVLSAPGQQSESYIIELEPGTTLQTFEFETDMVTPMPDTTPPNPNPMLWEMVPTLTSPNSIMMTAFPATDHENPPVQYYFECVNDAGKSSSWQSGTTYGVGGLPPGTQYSFRVKARDSSPRQNETAWSSIESATTEGGDTNSPAAPTGLTATDSDQMVSLEWNDNGETDLAGYNVYRSTTSGAGYVRLNVSLVTESNYIDTAVTNDITYYYVVTAVDDADNESVYSSEVSATPGYQTCPEVINADLALLSDLNGDCYVDSLDLGILANYWLYSDCGVLDDCEGSDFEPDGDVDFGDFSDFALQWLGCNDPEDPDCPPNW